MQDPARRLMAVLLAVVTALAGALAGIVVFDDDHDGRPDRVVVTVPLHGASVPNSAKVDGPDADGKRDDTITVKAAAADALEAASRKPGSELDTTLRQVGDTPATSTVPGPMAADETPGCRTRFVGNASSRNGARPSVIFLHQTVSHENGQASQDALTALASRVSSGVSWHYAIGRSDGLCTYTVPLALKAWTQANANPWAVGIEVEAYGNESTYVTGKGKAKLVSVIRYVAHRYGIPLRHGAIDTNTCRPTRSGIVEHSDGGLCAGGHIDVTIPPKDVASVIAAAARAKSPGPPSTARQRTRCNALRYHRRKVKAGAKWSDTVTVGGMRMSRGRHAGDLKRLLTAGHVDTLRYCA